MYGIFPYVCDDIATQMSTTPYDPCTEYPEPTLLEMLVLDSPTAARRAYDELVRRGRITTFNASRFAL